MTITIRFLDGARAGDTLSVEDAGEPIRIGRDPAQCQIVFGEAETKVSRLHCELRRVPDGYRLERNLERKMLLDGKPVLEGMRIKAGHKLTFGEGGPSIEVLSVELAKDDKLGKTEEGRGAPDKALVEVVQRNVDDLKSAKKELRETGKRVSNLGANLRKVAAAVAVLGLGSALGYWQSQRGIDANEARIAAMGRQMVDQQRLAKGSLQPVMQKVRDSVFLVVLRQSDNAAGAAEAVATAWTVAPGKVATNGHVAELQAQLQQGQKLVLRHSRLGARELRVTKVDVHPGYSRYPELVQLGRVADPANSGGMMSGEAMLACDVAVMEIAEADAALLGAPLELADDNHIQALQAGTPLGFVGHPTEGFIHGGVSLVAPVPTTQQGIVTAITGFMLEDAPADEALLVHFNMPAAGGASGSPVFDETGKVVAVLSAGNNYMLPPSLLDLMDPAEAGDVPRISIGGVNYGQSATMLRELLDGRAQARMQAHEAYWNAHLAKLAELGAGRTLQALVDQIQVERGWKLELAETRKGRLVGAAASTVAHEDLEFALPAKGEFLAITVPDALHDIDAILSAKSGLISADQQQDPYPIVGCKGNRNARITVRIETIALQQGEALPYTTYLFRVQQT